MPKQKLVIAEKPSVGMALAKVLGARGKRKGYMIGGGYIVSWCVGHLAGLADAAVYDPSYAKWRWNDPTSGALPWTRARRSSLPSCKS